METWEELKPTVDEQIATKFQSPVLRCARALRCYVARLTHCPCPSVSGNTVLTHAQEELDPAAASCSGRARGAWLCRVEPGLACCTLLTSPSFLQRANSFDKETSVAAWKLFRELVKTVQNAVRRNKYVLCCGVCVCVCVCVPGSVFTAPVCATRLRAVTKMQRMLLQAVYRRRARRKERRLSHTMSDLKRNIAGIHMLPVGSTRGAGRGTPRSQHSDDSAHEHAVQKGRARRASVTLSEVLQNSRAVADAISAAATPAADTGSEEDVTAPLLSRVDTKLSRLTSQAKPTFSVPFLRAASTGQLPRYSSMSPADIAASAAAAAAAVSGATNSAASTTQEPQRLRVRRSSMELKAKAAAAAEEVHTHRRASVAMDAQMFRTMLSAGPHAASSAALKRTASEVPRGGRGRRHSRSGASRRGSIGRRSVASVASIEEEVGVTHVSSGSDDSSDGAA